MTHDTPALERLRSANPVATVESLADEELLALARRCEGARRDIASAEVLGFQRTRASSSRHWVRGLAVAAAAFILVLAVVGLVGYWAPDSSPPAGSVVTTSVEPIAPPVLETEWQSRSDVLISDPLTWHTEGDTPMVATAYRPVAAPVEPAPVVVVFSEYCEGCASEPLARRIAEQGAVAFAPVWTIPEDFDHPPADYLGGTIFDRASCAVGFAQHYAEGLGGDPEDVTVIGSGGGEHPALWLALGHANTSRCEYPMTVLPARAVVGMGQYTMHMDYFDSVFARQPAVAQDAVDAYLNPETWSARPDLEVLVWMTDGTDERRDIETPIAEDSWIHARDTTGTLITDLADLGAFDDGVISYDDNALLLERRLTAGGVEVQVSYHPADTYTIPSPAMSVMLEMMGLEAIS